MRAVVMHAFGGEDVLTVEEVPGPLPGPGEALVRVHAVEVSSTRDIATRSGQHPFSSQVTLPHVLGGDFAGVIEAVGPGADPALVGQRVAASNSTGCGHCEACRGDREAQCPQLTMIGVHRWGSYAELVALPVGNLTPLPSDLPLSEAAAMAATGPIALTQLRTAAVAAGSWILVTGATGALATTLITLAASLGMHVIGLSRRPDKIPPHLASELILNSGDPRLGAAIRERVGEAGVEAVLDNVCNGQTFLRYFPVLATGARIVVSGAIAGDSPAELPVPAQPFYVRSLSLLGVRTTSRDDIAGFWGLVHRGLRLPSGLVHELPLEAAAQAHAGISEGAVTGHTVLRAG